MPDGCGGTLDCDVTAGGCPTGKSCGGGGVPNVCGAGSLHADDLRDAARRPAATSPTAARRRSRCGTCTAPQTCGGGGVANVCGCTPTTCGALGAQLRHGDRRLRRHAQVRQLHAGPTRAAAAAATTPAAARPGPAPRRPPTAAACPTAATASVKCGMMKCPKRRRLHRQRLPAERQLHAEDDLRSGRLRRHLGRLLRCRSTVANAPRA